MEIEILNACRTKAQAKRVKKVLSKIIVIKSYHTFINTIIIKLDDYIDKQQVQDFINSLQDKKIMYNKNHNAIAID